MQITPKELITITTILIFFLLLITTLKALNHLIALTYDSYELIDNTNYILNK